MTVPKPILRRRGIINDDDELVEDVEAAVAVDDDADKVTIEIPLDGEHPEVAD